MGRIPDNGIPRASNKLEACLDAKESEKIGLSEHEVHEARFSRGSLTGAASGVGLTAVFCAIVFLRFGSAEFGASQSQRGSEF